MLAANRVGKTEGVGGYETVLHATGRYPEWWEGRRFEHPISAVCSGTTGKTTRDIIQAKLLGPVGEFGTGLIPQDCIKRHTPKAGIQDAVELIYLEHITGGTSLITLKSYDQRRVAFEGEERHVAWLDEEPPLDIYTECLIRTMTVNGMVICTFTPMEGMSDVVMLYLDNGLIPGFDSSGSRLDSEGDSDE
jgi:phage terminase large subunit-like protein